MHKSLSELESGVTEIRRSPADNGRVEMIVSRPEVNGRTVLSEGELIEDAGLAGDMWGSWIQTQAEPTAEDYSTQLTLMNSRAIQLIATERDRWPLAGDQLFVDLALGHENLPPGTRLQAGTAVIEIVATPHTGCSQFVKRFGVDAMKFVNSPVGRELNLRGIYARIVQSGIVRTDDTISKIT